MNEGIYVISKIKHMEMWKFFRKQYPIISTWIDDPIVKAIDFSEAWPRYLGEAARAKYLLIYVEPEETLKGGILEMGAGLGAGAIMILVGSVTNIEALTSAKHHPRILVATDLDHAFEIINLIDQSATEYLSILKTLNNGPVAVR